MYSVPTIQTGTIQTSSGNLVLNPTGSIDCNSKGIVGVSSIVASGLGIDFGNKELSNIHSMQSDVIASGPSAGDVKFFAVTLAMDCNYHTFKRMSDLTLNGGNSVTPTNNRLVVYNSLVETLPRILIDNTGMMTFTDGSSSSAGSQGFFGKGTQGSFNMGFSSGAGDGTLYLKTITGPSSGLVLQAQSSGAISTLGALNNDTSITCTGTVQGSTVQGTTVKAKYGDSTYYFTPIVWFNYQTVLSLPVIGNNLYKSKTMPAGFMGTNGDGFEITITGNCASNGNGKLVNLLLGSTNVFTGTLQNNTSNMWTIFITLYRVSSTQISGGGYFGHGSTFQAVSIVGVTVSSLTTALDWSVTGTNVSAGNDITCRSFKMVFHPSQST